MVEAVWSTLPIVMALLLAVLVLARLLGRGVRVVVGGGEYEPRATPVGAGVSAMSGQARNAAVWTAPVRCQTMSGGPGSAPEASTVSISPTSLSVHPAQVLLAALGKAYFTSQTFADHAGATRRPAIRHGPWLSQRCHLEADNRDGMGVFFTVNHTDLRGRTAAHVTEVAAYFADFDGARLPGDWPLPPTAIVESSEGRYHVYWRVSGAPLGAFSHVQKHLSVLFDTDPKVHDLPRVMRLPGMVHAKSEPFLSHLILVDPGNVVEHDVFVDAFEVPPVETITWTAARAPAGIGRLRHYVWSAVQGEHDTVAAAPEGARNATLYRSAVKLGSLVGAGMLSEADASDALLAGVSASQAPLPASEAERTIASGLAFGRRHPRQLDSGDA